MRRILIVLIASAAVSAAAEVFPAPGDARGIQEILSAARSEAPVHINKCWRRAYDERIDYTGMPLIVCVNEVSLSAGRFRYWASTSFPGDGQYPPFVDDRRGEAAIVKRSDAAGPAATAVVYEKDYGVGDSSEIALTLRLDAKGGIDPASAVIKATIVCAPERCMGAEPDRVVEFKEDPR